MKATKQDQLNSKLQKLAPGATLEFDIRHSARSKWGNPQPNECRIMAPRGRHWRSADDHELVVQVYGSAEDLYFQVSQDLDGLAADGGATACTNGDPCCAWIEHEDSTGHCEWWSDASEVTA